MRPTLKYGLISGNLSGLWMFFQYQSGMYKTAYGALAGNLFYLILFFCVFIGIREFRESYSGGKLDIKEGLKAGLQIVSYSAVIHALYTYLFWIWVPADYFEHIVSLIRQFGVQYKKTDVEVSQQIEQFRINSEPFKQATSTILNTILPGIFSSMVFAFLLKK